MLKKFLPILLALSFFVSSNNAMISINTNSVEKFTEQYFTAIKKDDVKFFKTLKARYSKDIQELVDRYCDDDANNALHCACFYGHVDLVSFLINQCGANYKLLNYWEQNPLMIVRQKLYRTDISQELKKKYLEIYVYLGGKFYNPSAYPCEPKYLFQKRHGYYAPPLQKNHRRRKNNVPSNRNVGHPPKHFCSSYRNHSQRSNGSRYPHDKVSTMIDTPHHNHLPPSSSMSK